MPGRVGRGDRGFRQHPPDGAITPERLRAFLVHVGAACLQAGLEAEHGFPGDRECDAWYLAAEAARVAFGYDSEPQVCWEQIGQHEEALSRIPPGVLLHAALRGLEILGREAGRRKPSRPRPMAGLWP
jgi:hypothetical protein